MPGSETPPRRARLHTESVYSCSFSSLPAPSPVSEDQESPFVFTPQRRRQDDVEKRARASVSSNRSGGRVSVEDAKSTLAKRQRASVVSCTNVERQCAVGFASFAGAHMQLADTHGLLTLLDHTGFAGASSSAVERAVAAVIARPEDLRRRRRRRQMSQLSERRRSSAGSRASSVDSPSLGSLASPSLTPRAELDFVTFVEIVEELYDALGRRFRSTKTPDDLAAISAALPAHLWELLACRSSSLTTLVSAPSPISSLPAVRAEGGAPFDLDELHLTGATRTAAANAETVFVSLGGKGASLPGQPPSGMIPVKAVDEYLLASGLPPSLTGSIRAVVHTLCGNGALTFPEFKWSCHAQVEKARCGGPVDAPALARVGRRLIVAAKWMIAELNWTALRYSTLPEGEQELLLAEHLLGSLSQGTRDLGIGVAPPDSTEVEPDLQLLQRALKRAMAAAAEDPEFVARHAVEELEEASPAGQRDRRASQFNEAEWRARRRSVTAGGEIERTANVSTSDLEKVISSEDVSENKVVPQKADAFHIAAEELDSEDASPFDRNGAELQALPTGGSCSAFFAQIFGSEEPFGRLEKSEYSGMDWTVRGSNTEPRTGALSGITEWTAPVPSHAEPPTGSVKAEVAVSVITEWTALVPSPMHEISAGGHASSPLSPLKSASSAPEMSLLASAGTPPPGACSPVEAAPEGHEHDTGASHGSSLRLSLPTPDAYGRMQLATDLESPFSDIGTSALETPLGGAPRLPVVVLTPDAEVPPRIPMVLTPDAEVPPHIPEVPLGPRGPGAPVKADAGRPPVSPLASPLASPLSSRGPSLHGQRTNSYGQSSHGQSPHGQSSDSHAPSLHGQRTNSYGQSSHGPSLHGHSSDSHAPSLHGQRTNSYGQSSHGPSLHGQSSDSHAPSLHGQRTNSYGQSSHGQSSHGEDDSGASLASEPPHPSPPCRTEAKKEKKEKAAPRAARYVQRVVDAPKRPVPPACAAAPSHRTPPGERKQARAGAGHAVPARRRLAPTSTPSITPPQGPYPVSTPPPPVAVSDFFPTHAKGVATRFAPPEGRPGRPARKGARPAAPALPGPPLPVQIFEL